MRGIDRYARAADVVGDLRQVEIRVGDPSLIPELRQHFERSGFVVRAATENTLVVERPDAPTNDQGDREVAAQLAVWRVMHPGSLVE
jgi:hypothetical protein